MAKHFGTISAAITVSVATLVVYPRFLLILGLFGAQYAGYKRRPQAFAAFGIEQLTDRDRLAIRIFVAFFLTLIVLAAVVKLSA